MYKLKGKSETITDDTGASVFSFLLLLLLLFIIIIIIRLSLSPFSFYIHFIIFTSFFLSLSFPFTFSSCLFSFCFIPIVGSSPLRELKSVRTRTRAQVYAHAHAQTHIKHTKRKMRHHLATVYVFYSLHVCIYCNDGELGLQETATVPRIV